MQFVPLPSPPHTPPLLNHPTATVGTIQPLAPAFQVGRNSVRAIEFGADGHWLVAFGVFNASVYSNGEIVVKSLYSSLALHDAREQLTKSVCTTRSVQRIPLQCRCRWLFSMRYATFRFCRFAISFTPSLFELRVSLYRSLYHCQ